MGQHIGHVMMLQAVPEETTAWPLKMEQISCFDFRQCTINILRVTSEKTADLIYTSADAWNHEGRLLQTCGKHCPKSPEYRRMLGHSLTRSAQSSWCTALSCTAILGKEWKLRAILKDIEDIIQASANKEFFQMLSERRRNSQLRMLNPLQFSTADLWPCVHRTQSFKANNML